MGKISLSISQDSRFTEEIIKQYENNDKSDVNQYDIAFQKKQNLFYK